MSKLIEMEYEGAIVHIDKNAWINATEIASNYGKRVQHWLENKDTKAYMQALNDVLNNRNVGDLVKTKRGANGGTWLHPKLGVAFARWIKPELAVRLDLKIDSILRGDDETIKRDISRHMSKSSNKVLNEVLKLTREGEGKESKPYHYMNEARMINKIISGEYKSLDRDSLSLQELDLLAQLETRDAVLMASGKSWEERKAALKAFADEWIRNKTPQLENLS